MASRLVDKCGFRVYVPDETRSAIAAHEKTCGPAIHEFVRECLHNPRVAAMARTAATRSTFWYHLRLQGGECLEIEVSYEVDTAALRPAHINEQVRVRATLASWRIGACDQTQGLVRWRKWSAGSKDEPSLPPATVIEADQPDVMEAQMDRLRDVINSRRVRWRPNDQSASPLGKVEQTTGKESLLETARNVRWEVVSPVGLVCLTESTWERLVGEQPKIEPLEGQLKNMLKVGDVIRTNPDAPSNLLFREQITRDEELQALVVRSPANAHSSLEHVAIVRAGEKVALTLTDRRNATVAFNKAAWLDHVLKRPEIIRASTHFQQVIERPGLIVRSRIDSNSAKFYLYFPADLHEGLFGPPSVSGWWHLVVGYELGPSSIRGYLKTCFPDERGKYYHDWGEKWELQYS